MRVGRNDEARITRTSGPVRSRRRGRRQSTFKPEVTQEQIRVAAGSSYSDKSGTIETFGSSGVLLGTDTAEVLRKETHYITINGVKRRATEACAAYLALCNAWSPNTRPTIRSHHPCCWRDRPGCGGRAVPASGKAQGFALSICPNYDLVGPFAAGLPHITIGR